VSESLTIIVGVRAKPGQEARLLQELERLPAPRGRRRVAEALSEETNRVPYVLNDPEYCNSGILSAMGAVKAEEKQ